MSEAKNEVKTKSKKITETKTDQAAKKKAAERETAEAEKKMTKKKKEAAISETEKIEKANSEKMMVEDSENRENEKSKETTSPEGEKTEVPLEKEMTLAEAETKTESHSEQMKRREQKDERKTQKRILHSLTEGFTPSIVFSILLGTAIVSFGIYNVHQQAGITEGGVLGMILLLHHWFGIPPSIISPILDALCYALGFKLLGKGFLKLSIAATLSLAFFFRIWEQFPPFLPDLSGHPLLAALIGGLFVGTGVVFVVMHGASSGGDDALALVISKLTGWRLSRAYMVTDFTVLLISLSYIPAARIVFSLITVTVSSMTIEFLLNRVKGWFSRKSEPSKKTEEPPVTECESESP